MAARVLVDTFALTASSQIGRESSAPDELAKRAPDIQQAIQSVTEIVIDALELPQEGKESKGFQVTEFGLSFGITLGGEGNVLVSKATFSTTLEVQVKFSRG